MFDYLESLDLEALEEFITDLTTNADPDRLNNAEERLLELLKEKYEEIIKLKM